MAEPVIVQLLHLFYQMCNKGKKRKKEIPASVSRNEKLKDNAAGGLSEVVVTQLQLQHFSDGKMTKLLWYGMVW